MFAAKKRKVTKEVPQWKLDQERAEQEELERSLLGSAELGELERQGEEEEENTISHGSSLSLKLSLTEALSHAPFAHTPARAFFPRDHTIPSSPIVCTHHNPFPLLSFSSFQCVYKRAAATKAAL